MDNSTPYMTTEEAARYLGLSSSLLNKLRLTGGGPVFLRLAGRAIRYRRADLDAWANASAMASTSQAPGDAGTVQ
jgi:excisionase family DNA binding protein